MNSNEGLDEFLLRAARAKGGAAAVDAICVKIFSYLEQSDQYCLMMTCTYFYEMLREDVTDSVFLSDEALQNLHVLQYLFDKGVLDYKPFLGANVPVLRNLHLVIPYTKWMLQVNFCPLDEMLEFTVLNDSVEAAGLIIDYHEKHFERIIEPEGYEFEAIGCQIKSVEMFSYLTQRDVSVFHDANQLDKVDLWKYQIWTESWKDKSLKNSIWSKMLTTKSIWKDVIEICVLPQRESRWRYQFICLLSSITKHNRWKVTTEQCKRLYRHHHPGVTCECAIGSKGQNVTWGLKRRALKRQKTE